eukprot:m.13280 g.13280  ORF g.13280 m.13280 type:complete len:301 (-) comp10080_c0_seq2:231-1133(-)
MGADGGTVPTRGELVKMKKKDTIIDPKLEHDAKWNHCRLTSEPLKEPIVACELGRVYNKTSVLEFLVNKSEQPPDRLELMRHIRRMKDLTTLQLTKSKDYKDTADSGFSDRGDAQFCCPVIAVPMNGFNRFVFVRTTGLVVSEKAYKEVPTSCGDVAADDVIVLNGTPAEVGDNYLRMLDRRKAAKAAKTAAKAKAKADMPPPAGTTSAAAKGAAAAPKRKASAMAGDAASGVGAPRRATGQTINAPVHAAMTKLDALPKNVSEDARASKVLKSLFTSSKPKATTESGKVWTSRGGAFFI